MEMHLHLLLMSSLSPVYASSSLVEWGSSNGRSEGNVIEMNHEIRLASSAFKISGSCPNSLLFFILGWHGSNAF